MRTLKSLAIVFCLGLLFSATLRADEWDKKTTITFSGPVQVGNTQLPAGTYVFKLADTSDRHVVQIFNEDETHVYATILAIPDYRVEPADKTVIRFSENAGGSESSGTLPAGGIPIKEWFYPGDNSGQEFPVVAQPQVAAVQPEPAAAPAEPPAPEAAPTPAPEAAAPAPEAAPAPQEQATPAPEEQAAPATPAPAEQPGAPPATPDELPKTASSLPLIGLIGALSLAGAALFRIVLKISA